MQATMKIYTKEYTDTKKKQTYTFYKGILLNNSKTKAVFGDIKFYVKREEVEDILNGITSGVFNVELVNISQKTFKSNDEQDIVKHVFEVRSLTPLADSKDFEDKLEEVLNKENQKNIDAVLR